MDMAQLSAMRCQPHKLVGAAAASAPSRLPHLVLLLLAVISGWWNGPRCFADRCDTGPRLTIFCKPVLVCESNLGVSAVCNENRGCWRARCGVVLAVAFAGGAAELTVSKPAAEAVGWSSGGLVRGYRGGSVSGLTWDSSPSGRGEGQDYQHTASLCKRLRKKNRSLAPLGS